MEAIVSVLERAGRYLSLIRPMDVLDVAIIAYLVYKILCLVRSTRAENILKGVAIFLVALWLSSPAALNLRGVNYILSHMVEWGVLALIILFQPEIRQLLEKVGSRNIRLRDGHVIEDTVNSHVLSAAEALAALPKSDED